MSMCESTEQDPLLLDALRSEGLDTVEGAFAYGGGEDLTKPDLAHRRRTHLRITDSAGRMRDLYLKRYGRESLKDRIRRRWTYGRRRSPAGVEFDNIRAARNAGIETMREVLYAQQFDLFGATRSYLIVTAVPGDALERCFEDYLRAASEREILALTQQLGAMVRTLHDADYVHRDLYTSHVFLDHSVEHPRLYLIDLARMFSPRIRRFRWRVKDLSQLKYSAPRPWVDRFWDVLMESYGRGFDRDFLGRYHRAIDRKMYSMRRRRGKKQQPSPSGDPRA